MTHPDTLQRAKLEALIRAAIAALKNEDLNPQPAWFSQHTTLADALECGMDDPTRRGEVPLFVEAS